MGFPFFKKDVLMKRWQFISFFFVAIFTILIIDSKTYITGWTGNQGNKRKLKDL